MDSQPEHPTQPTPPPPSTRERPDGLRISGLGIILITLGIAIVVPTIVTTIYFVFLDEDRPDVTQTTELVWDQRQTWPREVETKFKSLKRGMMSAARTDETYRDFDFHLEPADQAAMIRASRLARDEAGFTGKTTRDELKQIADNHPALFYPRYLLGLWHQHHGDSLLADQHFAQAFDLAPAALLRRYVDSNGDSAAGVTVPPLAIAADQVVDDQLDRSVVLIYPVLKPDDEGFVYVPVYKTILRLVDLSADPSILPAVDKPMWFTFWGNVGRLRDVVIER